MSPLVKFGGILLSALDVTTADIPLYFDVLNWPHGTIDQSALHGKVPRVVFDEIVECPHPCGLMPEIKPTGEVINGGIPQLVNMTLHFETMRKTFDANLPDDDTRWLDFDYERYSPIWDRLKPDSPYVNKSLALVRQDFPQWQDPALIESYAKAQWEQATTDLIIATIKHIKKLRPGLRVMMYGYPQRYYWNGYDGKDGDTLRQQNDQLMPVFCELDALAPSVYQFYNSMQKPSDYDGNRKYVQANVGEAVRLAEKTANECSSGRTQVRVYTWHRYHESSTCCALDFLSDQDYEMFLDPLLTGGADGLIMWGAEGNAAVSDEFVQWYLSNFSNLVSSSPTTEVQMV